MNKPISTIIIEAVVVGAFLVAFYEGVDFFIKTYTKSSPNMWIKLFITGVIFHILFEVTGVNKWYSVEYVKILSK
jgi:hypothetical protein